MDLLGQHKVSENGKALVDMKSPDGRKRNMIDLILVKKYYANLAICVKASSSGDNGSDDLLILCNINVQKKQGTTKDGMSKNLNGTNM
jgi:hypothetical protein